MITRKNVARKLIDYLYHRITLEEMVNWAEAAMMDGDFEDRNFETIRDIISRLGLADVKAFGISWEDFENFLLRLGYKVDIKIIEIQAV